MLATWLESQLDQAARERVADARRQAFEELWAGQAVAPAADVATLAGVPTIAVARRLISEMSSAFGLSAAA